jgi:hypothetical protein
MDKLDTAAAFAWVEKRLVGRGLSTTYSTGIGIDGVWKDGSTRILGYLG